MSLTYVLSLTMVVNNIKLICSLKSWPRPVYLYRICGKRNSTSFWRTVQVEDKKNSWLRRYSTCTSTRARTRKTDL